MIATSVAVLNLQRRRIMTLARNATRNIIVCGLALCLLAAVGCSRAAPPPPSLSGKPGTSGIERLEKKAGKTSLTHADAHFVEWDDKLALLLVCDFAGHNNRSGADSDGGFDGHSSTADLQRVVEWRWRTLDGKSGTVVINGQKYDRAAGGLFLVDTQDEKPRVVQLKGQLKGDHDGLKDLARKDSQIRRFVAEASEPIPGPAAGGGPSHSHSKPVGR